MIARICSSLLNFKINQKAVFRVKSGKREFIMYIAMVVIALGIGTPLLALLTNIGWECADCEDLRRPVAVLL